MPLLCALAGTLDRAAPDIEATPDPVDRLVLGAQVHAALALANLAHDVDNRRAIGALGSQQGDASCGNGGSTGGGAGGGVIAALVRLLGYPSTAAQGAAAAALQNLCAGFPTHKQHAVAAIE